MALTHGEHISSQFDSDLEAIRSKVLQMGGLVEAQIRAAMEGFSSGNIDPMEGVIAKDHQVNAFEVEIDQDCAHIIARRQPAAGDLRTILASAKTVTDLERIGDEASKIARMAKQIHGRGSTNAPRVADVTYSAARAISMLRKTLDAYARLDSGLAQEIIREDDTVDNEFRAVLRQLITFMMEDPRTISTALDIVWIAKAIERIGDHAKNIAEYVIYIVEGTDVRHTAPVRSADGG
jgi:phosphate transport system protein